MVNININELPNPDLVKTLYEQYYLNDITPDEMVSSFWKEFIQKINVIIDNNGEIKSFRGYGFGGLQHTHVINRIAHYLSNISHFIRLPYKKDIRFLSNFAKQNLKIINCNLSPECFRQICSLSVIRKYFKAEDIDKFHIIIIGDGSGFLSSLLKKIYLNSKITLVDIGKVLLFQAVNLQKIYPNCIHSILLGENSNNFNKFDFLYVPAEKLFEIKYIKYKLIINIASMQEMNYQTINNYFKFIRLNATKDNIFYCCNREIKILPAGEIIEFAKFPWSKEDNHFVDEECPFLKYYFSGIAPFFHRYRGKIIHRVTNLKIDI